MYYGRYTYHTTNHLQRNIIFCANSSDIIFIVNIGDIIHLICTALCGHLENVTMNGANVQINVVTTCISQNLHSTHYQEFIINS